MGGFRAHIPLSPDPRGHFLDKVGGSGDFGYLALWNVEPGVGERRLDLRSGHALRFHDAVSPCTRQPEGRRQRLR
jgi:hypothetical protein